MGHYSAHLFGGLKQHSPMEGTGGAIKRYSWNLGKGENEEMPTTSENGIHPGYNGREKFTKHHSNKTRSAAKGTIMGNERQHKRKDGVPPACPKVRCGLLSKNSNKIILTELLVQWEEHWKNRPLKERMLNIARPSASWQGERLAGMAVSGRGQRWEFPAHLGVCSRPLK